MMNKKAVAWGVIIGGIVGLFIIALVVMGPLQGAYKFIAGKFFGAPVSEEQFVPYAGPVLVGEDKIIHDSMNALLCAYNSMALGKPAWKEGKCPEGFTSPDMPKNKTEQKPEQKTVTVTARSFLDLTGAVTKEDCKGALYGQTCVDCYESELGMRDIRLSLDDRAAMKQLVAAVIDCWGKFEKNSYQNVYCSKIQIPTSFELYNKTGTVSWRVTKKAFLKELNGREGIGDELGGFSIGITRLGQNFDWDVPDPLLFDFPTYYICADNAGVDEVFITSDLSQCPIDKSQVKDKEFACDVLSFELPQEIGRGDLVDWAVEFIKKYKDPKHVVYYESFPVGENAVWHIDPGSFWIDVIFFGAVMNVVPLAGRGWSAAKGGLMAAGRGVKGLGTGVFDRILGREIKAIGKEITEESLEAALRKTGVELGKELSEDAIRELTEVFGKEGYERILKSQKLYEALLPDLGEAGAESVRTTFVTKYSFYKRLDRSDDEIVKALLDDDIPKALNLNKLGASETALFKKVGFDDFIKKPLAEIDDTFKNQIVAKQFFTNHLLDDAGKTLKPGVMDELFSRAVTKELMDELGPEATEQIMSKSLKYTDAMVDVAKEGDEIVKVPGLIGASVKDAAVGQIRKEIGLFADAVTGLNAQSMERFLLGVTVGEVNDAIAEKGAIGLIKGAAARYNPVYIMGKQGKIIPIPRPLLVRAIGSVVGTPIKGVAAGAKLTKDMVGAAWQSRAMRYIAAYIIANQIAMADAENEKYQPHGGNTLVWQKPYNYELNRKYDIVNESTDYYLNLFKYKNANTRFFMASPCKADMTITKTMCSCEIKRGTYVLGSIKQPFDPAYVQFEEGSIQPIHLFDSLSPDKREEVTGYCLSKETGFGQDCSMLVGKHPVVYPKFVRYIYDEVYVPAIQFMKEESLHDTLERVIRQQGDVGSAIGVFAIQNLDKYGGKYPGPDFGAFCMFGTGGVGPCSAQVPFGFSELLVESRTGDVVKLRKEPLPFENFSVEFDNALTAGYFRDAVFDIYYKLHVIRANNIVYFTFLLSGGSFLSSAANNTYLNYYLVDDTKVDTSKVAKFCDSTALEKTTDGVFEDDFTKGRFSVPCFNAQASLDIYADYNNGNNFCFSGDHSDIETAKWFFTGLAVAIDVGVGLTGVGLIVEAPVSMITGAGAAYIGQQLDTGKYWPNH